MGVEEVIEKTTINFDRGLNLEEVEGLLRYIAKESEYGVRYTVETGKDVRKKEAKQYYERVIERTESQRVTGCISAPGVAGLFPFECYFETGDELLCDKLKFTQTPGVSLGEYREEEVGIWDNTRELIDKYFLTISLLSVHRRVSSTEYFE